MKTFHTNSNKLIGNIISLIILQGSNYIFPLLTFPYLVRTLGVENYGVLVFCLSIMQFFNIFIDYGFNISGTRDISVNKKNHSKVNEIFNLIFTIKLLLLLIFSIVYVISIESFSFFQENQIAFLLSLLIIIGNNLFPIWLYQGLEKMKYITYTNISVKVLVTVFIFLFIKNVNSLNLAVFFQTLYYLLPGLISIFIVKYRFNLKFKLILDRKKIVEELNKGKYIFMTNLWINFYSQGPLLLLGFVSGNNAAGNFGIGQKVQSAFAGLFQPITQAVYPYLCDLFVKNKKQFNLFKNKVLVLGFIVSFIISAVLFIFSGCLVKIIAGYTAPKIELLIKFFSVIVFLSIMNTIIARVLYAMDKSKFLNRTYLVAAIFFTLLSLPLSFTLQEVGMSIVVIIAEAIVFMLNIKSALKSRKTYEV